MFMSYRKLRSSLFPRKCAPQKEHSMVVSSDKLKFSIKEIFVKRNKAKQNNETSALTTNYAAQRHSTSVVDVEMVEALQSVFEALHDPSILDARRNQRYDLYAPIVVPETPHDIIQHHEIIHTLNLHRKIATEHPYAIRSTDTSSSRTAATSAVIEVSGRSDVDIIEVMRIPRAASARGESGSITGDISTEALLNSATDASLSFPLPEVYLPAADTCMASTGADSIQASQQELCPPAYSGSRMMDAADMKLLRFLGEGTSGKVYFVKDQISRAKVALKVVEKKDKNAYTLSIIVQEVDILKMLSDSPWFVNLYGSWHDSDNMYIAMAPYPTDLDSELIRLVKLEPDRARFYMAEIIIALTELHKRGIIHRDIKAPNILIDREGHVVLADFGLSKNFRHAPSIAERVYQPYWPYLPHENPSSATEPRDPSELYFVAWDYRGSELEMAPEIHLREAYSFGVDFWSASVVLYWMLTGRPPWYEQEDCDDPDIEVDDKPLALKIAEDDLYFDPSDNVDDEAQDFLQQMLVKNPKKRLMIDYEMPNHPYFAGVNWPLLEARAVPAPWIPEFEICHVYEPTAPVFVPGSFNAEDEDPYPTFTYISKQAKRRVIYEECDDVDSDSEYESESIAVPDSQGIEEEDECAGATFVESPLNEDGVFGDKESSSNLDITLLNSPIIKWDPSVVESPLKQASVDSDISTHPTSVIPSSIAGKNTLREGWNVTIISLPATAPYSPGPKGWLHAQDLIRICPRSPATIASSATSTSSIEVMYLPRQPSSIDTAQDDQASQCERQPRSDASGALASASQAPASNGHGSGLLSKAKQWWKSKPWTPKPKMTSRLLNGLATRNSQFGKKRGHLNSEVSCEDSFHTPSMHISPFENVLKDPARK